MLATTHSAALSGIQALPVQVEVNTDLDGDPRLMLVGLPDTSVRESQDRVISAIINSGFRTPYSRTTVNLAPGDMRKEGPCFDLPIALGVLAATGQVSRTLPSDIMFAGELSLSGETRPIRGALPMAIMARSQGFRGIVLPPGSAEEAALVDGIEVYRVESLSQTCQLIETTTLFNPISSETALAKMLTKQNGALDFADIKGQYAVRRAVEVAVAGAHNLLFIGPPGSGKSMIAKRIPSIMPPPSLEEFLEILSIHSCAGISAGNGMIPFERPFRSPHHTISDVGLIGGGSHPGPGEISLAHNGVLFLDELPEFKRSTLEVLRQPLEDRQVTISRSRAKITLPCSFMLVAAMNPTPCGGDGRNGKRVRSTPAQIQKYRSRISGPLLDRIDIHVEVPALGIRELRQQKPGECSQTILSRVLEVRRIQRERFQNQPFSYNAGMGTAALKKHCQIKDADAVMLERAMEEMGLSARAYDRILRVARTLADLDQKAEISSKNLFEAIGYRSLDRSVFHT